MPISAFPRVYWAHHAAPLLLVLTLFVQPEVPGYAELQAPATDQVVTGVVSLVGTANHPSFESYRLEFSYDPDPTDTWFPIGETIRTPVQDGRLAIWDTGQISDGLYRIRLTVELDTQESLVAVVSGIRVRNYTEPTPAPAAAPAQPTVTATLPLGPTTAAPAPEQPAPPDPFAESLRVGIAAALAAMATLAGYLWLAPRARNYAAYLKTRRLHRKVDRDRRGGRRA